MTEIPACKYSRTARGVYTFYIPESYVNEVENEHARLWDNRISQAYFKFGKPLKPRGTGKDSLNHAIHGYASQIASHVGESKTKIINDAVKRALLTVDFRTYTDYKGDEIPIRESEPWSTAEASAVRQALIDIASFCDIALREIPG